MSHDCACGDGHECAPPQILTRRQLLASAAAASFVPVMHRLESVAGPFDAQDYTTLVPPDKKLNPDWVNSLTERGEPDIWRGDELRWIGMPVGGICCGQVYLGGDGRLWHWDIFHSADGSDLEGITTGKHYANPMVPGSPFEQAFYLRIGDDERRALDRSGGWDMEFRGEYPIARIKYSDPRSQIRIETEVLSPYIPLDVGSSTLPLVRFEYRVCNDSDLAVDVELIGTLENPAGRFHGFLDRIERVNSTSVSTSNAKLIANCREKPLSPARDLRPEVVFADFEADDYGGFTATGTAFHTRPYRHDELPERYRPANPRGRGFVNTHNAHAGEDSVEADKHVGKLTSPEFTIERKHINFLIGGGNHPGKTCINLLVDGKVVASETGRNSLTLRAAHFDVAEHEGKRARLEIVDDETGGWGHITIDHIVFSDEPAREEIDVPLLPDFGSLAIQVSCQGAKHSADPGTGNSMAESSSHSDSTDSRVIGTASSRARIPAGESETFVAYVAWFYPNYGLPKRELSWLQEPRPLKRHYSTQFQHAGEVIDFVAQNDRRLAEETRLWNRTWYDSTLPYWFLDRTFIPIDCLATATAHRFASGRYYGWEGVYCCAGTCQHVWNYAQAAARIFPEFEQYLRKEIDFGISWHEDGSIDYRAEHGRHIAHDGLAGTIARTYREHTMRKDNEWLRSIWPRVKQSVRRLIAEDPNRDGLMVGGQYNTLDATWFGKISWISSLYLAALRTALEMAKDVGDRELLGEIEPILERGPRTIVEQTFNGEYFEMVRDPNHREAPGHGPGCHIDQVFGDSYLRMIGLPGNLDPSKVRSALQAIWKHNYTPDAGGYMKAMQSIIKGGRWYAMPGEGGLLMTSWPKGGAQDAKGEGNPDWMVGYFNECMNGFEYQAAAHMIAEGMLTEGLAIVRTLHDRYHPARRNPYNEIECSDHYSRSMAAYGAFLTACGFEYHGPRKHIGFAPKVHPERFKAPFTSAAGWGTYEQTTDDRAMRAEIRIAYGSLDLKSVSLQSPHANEQCTVTVLKGAERIPARTHVEGDRIEVHLEKTASLRKGERLMVSLAF